MRRPLCRRSAEPKALSGALRSNQRTLSSSDLGATGFTLLEMLLVITLLAATAGLGLATYADADGSARDAETRRKLALIEQGIVGIQAPAFGGEVRLSGFVADMGRLPSSMDELLAQVDPNVLPPPTLIPYGLRDIAYDASPQADGLQHSALPTMPPKMSKQTAAGLRQQVQTGANDTLRDGWGNALIFSVNANELSIISTGRDAAIGGGDDQALSIKNWQVSLAAWPITLKNNANSPHNLKAVLLSHEGLANGAAQWRQRSSTEILVAAGESQTLSLSLPSSMIANQVVANQVALGRHLLLLIQDNQPVAQRWVDLYPGVLPAPVTLTVLAATTSPAPTPTSTP